MRLTLRLRGLALPVLVALGACTDREPLLPEVPIPDRSFARVDCRVTVRTGDLRCETVPPAGGDVSADRVIGGNDIYVRLASSNLAYDSATEVLSVDVTIQNLTTHVLGTTDGSTVEGVKLFFHGEPTRTGGTGSVSILNADGTGTFTATLQPYFLHSEILEPMEISAPRGWQFQVDSGVATFTFSVLVSAPMMDQSGPLADRVWTGSAGTAWEADGSWQGAAAPVATSTVAVPNAGDLVTANMPVLAAAAAVKHLRVGAASTLELGTFTLDASGNVDAVGEITGGTLRMSGSGSLLRGSVDAVEVAGGTRLQGSTRATGVVTVTGTLDTGGNVLTIAKP